MSFIVLYMVRVNIFFVTQLINFVLFFTDYYVGIYLASKNAKTELIFWTVRTENSSTYTLYGSFAKSVQVVHNHFHIPEKLEQKNPSDNGFSSNMLFTLGLRSQV